MNKNTNLIAIGVTLVLLGFVTSISGSDYSPIIIRSPSNTSLCVRTRAYKSSAAIIKLEDCERPMYYYNGQKVHHFQVDPVEPPFISSMWTHSAAGYGVGGCMFSYGGYVRVNEECAQNALWEFTPHPQNSTLTLWKNVLDGKCVRAPQIADEINLQMDPCDVDDINQQWLLETAELKSA